MLLLLFVACKRPPEAPAPPAFPVTLHLAALNDFHGGLYEAPVKGQEGVVYGGLPWLVAAVDALRAEDPELIVLDGGDEFQGSWPVNATQGKGSIEALRLLRVDAAAVGNHEFDYGPSAESSLGGAGPRGALEGAARDANWFLTANVTYPDGTAWAPQGVQPWKVIERKGLRIGVVGLTTTDTPTTTLPDHVADLRFRDPVETVRELLPALEAADLDATILVGHLTGSCKPEEYARNADTCTPDGEIGRLLTELPEGTFDAMVLGHAHTVLHHRVGKTFLLENRSSGHLLGRLDLVVGPDGVDVEQSVVHDPWPIVHAPADPGCEDRPYAADPLDVGGRTLAPDALAIQLVDDLEARAGSLCDEIACADHLMPKAGEPESELGAWMAEALIGVFEGADLAIQNGGGVRADLPAGPVRRESLQRVMPFDNRALLVELTGAQVRELFRAGTSGAHGLLHLAGGEVRFDASREAGTDRDGDGEVAKWERDRLCSVTVGGQPLVDDRTYRVVTSDFLYKGGDHLALAFQGAKVLQTGPLLRDVFFEEAAGTTGCLGATPLPRRLLEGPCP